MTYLEVLDRTSISAQQPIDEDSFKETLNGALSRFAPPSRGQRMRRVDGGQGFQPAGNFRRHLPRTARPTPDRAFAVGQHVGQAAL